MHYKSNIFRAALHLIIPTLHQCNGRVPSSSAAAPARGMVAYLAREEAGLTVTEVARYFARDTVTLRLAVRRLEDRLAADPQLSAKVTQLRRVIRRGGRRRRNKQIIKA